MERTDLSRRWQSLVGCASLTFCVAVDQTGNALSFNGSSWTAPLSVDGGNHLTSVSCPSASFCLAVDAPGNQVQFDGSSMEPPDRDHHFQLAGVGVVRVGVVLHGGGLWRCSQQQRLLV